MCLPTFYNSTLFNFSLKYPNSRKKKLKDLRIEAGKDGSAVKHTCCSFRGPNVQFPAPISDADSTTCNFSSKESKVLFCPPWATE